MPDRWVQHHFAVRAAFSSGRWGHSVRNQVLYTHVWPVCWLPMLDKSGESKSVEVMKVWEVSDDRLRFMSAEDSRTLRGAVESREISAAWEIWSYAAESSLIDAFCPSGGPMPVNGFVRGRSGARFKKNACIGAPNVGKTRSSKVDARERCDPAPNPWDFFCCVVAHQFYLNNERGIALELHMDATLGAGTPSARKQFINDLSREIEFNVGDGCVL